MAEANTATPKFSPTTFLSKLADGGALQSLFSCSLSGSGSSITDMNPVEFLCHATSFPASTITATAIAYMGREINIPGNRAAETWSTTIYNDEGHTLRNGLIAWMNKLNNLETNTRAADYDDPSKYGGTMAVRQFSKSSTAITNSVKFFNIWPSSVAEISLDWATSEIQDYEVTWEFSHWEVVSAALSSEEVG
jgi:hypothetical protein